MSLAPLLPQDCAPWGPALRCGPQSGTDTPWHSFLGAALPGPPALLSSSGHPTWRTRCVEQGPGTSDLTSVIGETGPALRDWLKPSALPSPGDSGPFGLCVSPAGHPPDLQP